jgi:dolichol-phosphate mannosyltransferase
MKISVIMPVYNERGTLALVLERVRQAALPDGCSKEIVVVDDGSTDGTAQAVGQHAQSAIILGRHYGKNRGKGCAIRTGIGLASGDVILIQDGDLEYDPSDYERIVRPITSGEADVVYGSRFLGCAVGMAKKYRIANWILTAAANLLYSAHLTDEATAYKAFRASVLRSIELECRRFDFCSEVTAKLCRLGHRIREVPISYNARGIAEGKKIRFVDGLEALWTLFKYRIAPLRTFVRNNTAGQMEISGASSRVASSPR